jgi:hypothetical protein
MITMTQKEYKICLALVSHIIKDVKKDMANQDTSVDAHAIKGAMQFMIRYLEVWKDILSRTTTNTTI